MSISLGNSQIAYLVLLALVVIQRLAELVYSKANQRQMAEHGAERVPDAAFPWMVATHMLVIGGAAIETVVLNPPLIPWLTWTAGALFLASNLLRVWVIITLRGHWNVNIVDSSTLGVVSSGPYRWVRHPNYTAVFVEMLALPLIHTALFTAVIGLIVHSIVLRKRVEVEDKVLLSSAEYRRVLGGKPKFFPNLTA